MFYSHLFGLIYSSPLRLDAPTTAIVIFEISSLFPPPGAIKEETATESNAMHSRDSLSTLSRPLCTVPPPRKLRDCPNGSLTSLTQKSFRTNNRPYGLSGGERTNKTTNYVGRHRAILYSAWDLTCTLKAFVKCARFGDDNPINLYYFFLFPVILFYFFP